MATVREFIQRLPKAELHVHLEGSLEPETLRELNPSLTQEEIAERYAYQDFNGFLKAFAWAARHLTGPQQYGIATTRLLERLERENVRYAEITFAAGVAQWLGLDIAAIHTAICEAAAQSRVETWWIWDITRQWGPMPAYDVLEMAIERVGDGVIAFGMGGDEARGPALWYRDHYRRARDAGLRLVCHAGEVTGPESIWDALEIGAERIGHGIRCVHDARLMRHLKEADIPLEVSISSNVRTGAVANLESHPLAELKHLPLTLNTDDPPMFGATLNGEYELAVRHFGFEPGDLLRVAANGFRYAFRWNRPFPELSPA